MLCLTALGCGPADESSGRLAAADSMQFVIDVPSEVKTGVPVPVTLRLTNTTDRPLTVYLQGRPTAFDVVVANQSGAVVWSRLAGETIQAILGVQTLVAGEALTFAGVWPQRDQSGQSVPPGRYTVMGILPTDTSPIRTDPKPVRILPAS